MPPRTKALVGLTSLIESDSEPDLDNIDSRQLQMARDATKNVSKPRPRGRPPTKLNNNKIAKPSQRGGRRSAVPLQERSANASWDAQVDPKMSKAIAVDADPLDDDTMPPKPKRGRPKASAGSAVRGARNGDTQPKPGRGRPRKTQVTHNEEIPETQHPEPMEVDEHEEEVEQEDDATEPMVGSDGDLGDAHIDIDTDETTLRRRLGELTKRYESLENRHKDLREVGVKEAERNYDRLKKQSEENTAAANKLISELRAQLSTQASLANRLERSEAKCDSLQSEVTELNTSLSAARAELKTLSTKLAAARNAEANIKVPGSALKTNAAGNRGPPAEVVQAAQAKEDLYGDLTGLIVRGMKHEDKEDVFDCIQTGRNGTLHFKLALDTADAGENYEAVEYTYRPQLDPNRDEELQMVLPDYLLGEITFPRTQASKFFKKVSKYLTEVLD